MNVTIEGKYKNMFSKSGKDKKTGEIVNKYTVQMEQSETLEDGQIKFIPIDTKLVPNYKDKKHGDTIKVPCNVYGENFASIKISKYKN